MQPESGAGGERVAQRLGRAAPSSRRRRHQVASSPQSITSAYAPASCEYQTAIG